MGSKISFVSLFALGALFISGCEINVNTTSTIKPGTIDLIAPSISSFKVPATSSSLVVGPIEIIAADNVAVGGYVLSDSNVVPLVSAGLFNSVAPTSFTFSSAGQKNLYAFVVDTSGNVSPVASASVVISLVQDSVAPVVNTFSLPATSTTLSVPILSLSASDANGIAGYFLKESSSRPLATDQGWASSFTKYDFTSSGSKNLYAFAKDPNGNVSVGKLASVTISAPADTVAPVVTFNPPATASSLTVFIVPGSASASDNVGVTGFALSESSVPPSSSGFTTAIPGSFTFGSAGLKTLYLYAKDGAGNIGSKSAQITITLPSQITATLAPIADTYISNSDVHSAEAALHTYTWGNYNSANAILMKFDLSSIPQTAVIDNAVLKMYLVEADASVDPYVISIHGIVNKNVDVNKATGLTYDGVNPWTAVSGRTEPMALGDISAQAATMPIDKVLGIKSVAIPQLVQNMVSNPGSNFGMLLNSDAGVVQDRYRYFASLEDGDPARKPSLVVTYHTGPSADTSAPVVTFSMPSSASSLVVPISSFTASDNVGVTGYLLKETSSIPLASNSGFAPSAQPSYTFTTPGLKTLYAFAKDAAGNISTVKSASVTITLPVVVTESLFTSSTVPGAKENDGTPYEMGMRFRSASSGQISAIRFYKVAEDTGVHVGSIFSTNGSKLASVTFSGESLSGWQSQALPSPVSIQANVDYVVSVTSPTGNYGYTEYAFNSPITRGNLTGLGSLFGPSDGSIPDQTWVGHGANYFRDIVFTEGYVDPLPTGSATLSWIAPTAYTDGNPMPAGTVTGYKISYRTSSGTPTVVTVPLSAGTSNYVIGNLPLGSTYYFSVLATSNAGDGESTAELPKSL